MTQSRLGLGDDRCVSFNIMYSPAEKKNNTRMGVTMVIITKLRITSELREPLLKKYIELKTYYKIKNI